MKTATDDRGIVAAVSYINQHACEGLGVDQVMKETQRVAKPVFILRFRASTGQTPRAAILRRQLDGARRLLVGTELSLVFIAEHCGFGTLKALER
ncbi:MAG: AraC family transcriptional regulator, partial [Verrucomicrobia bacterium]|nr:AraC family transcriptional regulator [Verrucomicrobiota bacterium]